MLIPFLYIITVMAILVAAASLSVANGWRKLAKQLSSKELHEMSTSKEKGIDEILEQNVLWVESGGKKGKRADLRYCDFSFADLSGVNLSGDNLAGVAFNYAYLRGANLAGADLSGACFCDADLIGANLTGANLTGAYLRGAYLCFADLTDANLSGVDFRGVNLEDAKGVDQTIGVSERNVKSC